MSNSVVRAYPKTSNPNPILRFETRFKPLCPRPPETSDSSEVDGGILLRDGKARCECGELWIIGEYVCKHCGFESELPF